MLLTRMVALAGLTLAGLTLAGLALALLPTARADNAVLKSTEHGQPAYKMEIGQDCSFSIRLEQQADAKLMMSLRHSPLNCRPTVADETAAIGTLLASMAGDGVSIRELKTFALGRVMPAAWKQQVADCFLKNRARGDRRAPPRGRVFAEMLAGCNVFTELNGVFGKFGAKLAISDIEKVEAVNLENLDYLRKEGMPEEWIDARRANRDHGIVPLGGFVYFRMTPYP